MIRISQIDDELSIYKNNTVVLLGLGNGFKQMFDLLQYHGIEVNCICDNNKDNFDTTHNGLKVISPPELKKMIESENSNVVVQVAIKDMDEVTIDLLSNMGAKAVILFDEFVEFSSSLRKKHGSSIRISQIDDEMSIYMNNTVVLLGLGNGVNPMLDLLNYHNIKANCIFDSNKENWGEIRHGYPVISPKHLELMATNNNIVVQIVSKNVDKKFIEQLSNAGIKVLVSYDEFWNVAHMMSKLKFINLSSSYNQDLELARSNVVLRERLNFRKFLIESNNNDILILCSPQKTGNTTIEKTLKSKNIALFKLDHEPTIIDKSLLSILPNQIKLILGVRDSISQHLSSFYQRITSSYVIDSIFLSNVSKNNINLFKNGGNVQELFDLDTDYYESVFALKYFLDSFKTSILDISKYPFDKEKGHTIIKEGNIEVFVYQLEKMNNIAKEMSDWIGQTSFDEWIIDNEANSKWIANSYKQAQIDITFSKEYFDKCYNDPWVKHFYSDKDIEKFKERWRPHIKA